MSLAGVAQVSDRIADVVPKLRALAPESEQQRWLTDESLEILGDTGLWRACVPKRFGGLDLSLREQMEVAAQLGRADGSLAWTCAIWLTATWTITLFPEEAQQEVFADGEVRVSAAFAPTGVITPADDGFTLNGSWKWNTGCRGAQWDTLVARLERPDGPPELYNCLVPRDALEIKDDWFAIAASATGSSEVIARDVHVPAHRVIKMSEALVGETGDRSNVGATGRNYPLFAFIAVSNVGPFLGMAQAAYELFLERLPGRGITYTPWTDQSASPVTHIQVGTAASKIAAARGLASHCVDLMQEAADAGVLPSVAVRASIRGYTGLVAELCREAVEILYRASGASVIMRDVPMQRVFRDVVGLAQHATVLSTTNFEVQGRVAVGLDPATPFL